MAIIANTVLDVGEMTAIAELHQHLDSTVPVRMSGDITFDGALQIRDSNGEYVGRFYADYTSDEWIFETGYEA